MACEHPRQTDLSNGKQIPCATPECPEGIPGPISTPLYTARRPAIGSAFRVPDLSKAMGEEVRWEREHTTHGWSWVLTDKR